MVRIGLLLFLFSYYSSEAAVVINEVASKGSTSGNCGSNDWIELYNDGDEDVDLSQYILYDDKGASSADAFRFPEGTAIDAGGYLVLCNEMKLLGENGQEIADPQSPQFGIGGDDIITLAIADSADTAFATGLVRQALPHVIADQVALPDQHHQENVSFARFASSQRGAFYDYTSTPTPGTDNVATDLLTEEQLAVQHKAALEARNALATAFFNMDDQGLPVPDALPDVLELHVTMNVSEYQTMIEKAYYEVYRPFDEVKIIDPNNQNIIAATTVPGRVRTRGQATLFYAVCLDSKGDIPFQIDFGDDTPLLGMSKVYLRTHAGDFSYMRDYAMNRMLARFGLVSYCFWLCRVNNCC